ncbi:MAG TPA: VWA domain-containing protein, partial [Thermoanaerobaculia bacterium]
RSFLIAFDESPRLVNETTNDLPMLMSRIEEMRVQGGTTVLYDAIMFALLQFEGTSGKKALVVVSDGDDRSSRYTPREVAEFARRSGVAIYPIILNSRLENLRRVAAMAARTGGKAFAIQNTRNLDVIYREIDAQLGGQYAITIAPRGEQKAGDVRSVDVRVATPDTTVQATPGYEVR